MDKEEFLALLPNIPDEKLIRISNSIDESKYTMDEIQLSKEELLKRSQNVYPQMYTPNTATYNNSVDFPNTNSDITNTADIKTATLSKAADKSLMFALISLITWIIPLFGFPTTVLSIVFGIKGINSPKKTKAIIGISLGGLLFLVTLINSVLGAIGAVVPTKNNSQSALPQFQTENNSQLSKENMREMLDKANQLSQDSNAKKEALEKAIQEAEQGQ